VLHLVHVGHVGGVDPGGLNQLQVHS
jgi:hypothetical protein